jgi:hypothetical protein
MKPFLIAVALFATLGFAPEGLKIVVGIKDGKPNPQNADVQSRKVDTVYFQNSGSEAYEIRFTDKTNGSPFQAPGTPADKSKISLRAFQPPSGPFKVHDLATPGKYPYDVMVVRGGKTSRAGGGSVVVE